MKTDPLVNAVCWVVRDKADVGLVRKVFPNEVDQNLYDMCGYRKRRCAFMFGVEICPVGIYVGDSSRDGETFVLNLFNAATGSADGHPIAASALPVSKRRNTHVIVVKQFDGDQGLVSQSCALNHVTKTRVPSATIKRLD